MMRNQLSKIIFPELLSIGHVRYSLEKRAIIFPLKVQVCLLRVQKFFLKKNTFSKKNFPQIFPL